jgi:hypothetical protein
MCIGLGSTDRRRALCNREFSIASGGAASGGQRTEMASEDQGVVLAHDVENPMNDPATTDDLLGDLDGLRTRARRDRRATSTPLLALGAATVVAEGAVIGALGASLLIAGALARLRERASA